MGGSRRMVLVSGAGIRRSIREVERRSPRPRIARPVAATTGHLWSGSNPTRSGAGARRAQPQTAFVDVSHCPS